MSRILFIPLLLVLGACAFNGSYYQPNTNKVHDFPDAESIYIPYGKQDSIHSFFFKQEDPVASLFLLHGNAGNLTSWGEVGDIFFQAGYQVMIIDYPGFGNSTGKASHKNVFPATQAAADYFLDHEQVKGTKKVLMGFSLGGNLAVKIGHDNPELFDAMLLEGAFESHKAIAVDRVPRPFKFAPYLVVKNAIKGRELIKTWNKPLLVIHSKDDAVCSYEMGKSLYENAINTSQKELWTINGPHLAGLGQNFNVYLAKLKTLVDKIP